MKLFFSDIFRTDQPTDISGDFQEYFLFYRNSVADNRTDALGPTLQPTDISTERIVFGEIRKYS